MDSGGTSAVVRNFRGKLPEGFRVGTGDLTLKRLKRAHVSREIPEKSIGARARQRIYQARTFSRRLHDFKVRM